MADTLDLEALAARELPALQAFGAHSLVPAGFGYLGPDGEIMAELGAQLWINCRVTHMFSLFALADINADESRKLATHGVRALLENFQDQLNGGWFSWIDTELDQAGKARPRLDKAPRKEAYAHAFVLLAGASAMVAGIRGGEDLFNRAAEIQDAHWWEPEAGRVRESFAPDWSDLEDYRGANANMHTVEACLAAFDAARDPRWLKRAAAISTHLINEKARENAWRLPEHYTANWETDLDYNRDKPTDPFRPWGATPGHGFEWARLITQLKATAETAGLATQLHLDWVEEAAAGLYQTALESWGSDGADGIPYTTDFAGIPVSSQRMHWVVCEALAASLVLSRYCQPGDSLKAIAASWAGRFGEYAQKYLIEEPGRWRHELDATNAPATLTWPGKPDIYHAGQAMFLVNLPVAPSFAKAVADGK